VALRKFLLALGMAALTSACVPVGTTYYGPARVVYPYYDFGYAQSFGYGYARPWGYGNRYYRPGYGYHGYGYHRAGYYHGGYRRGGYRR
jgi:hypothetical protein